MNQDNYLKFKDPNAALNGPPTQNISGVIFKSPSVDNPNIKLQTQTVKNLTNNTTDGSISQQVIPSDLQSIPDLKGNNNKFVSDGLGKNWSPNKFDPASVSDNKTGIRPKTTPRIKTVEILKTENVL